MEDNMKVIGLTGGVGCGKSTVAQVIREKFKAVVLIADDIGFELMQPGKACYNDIVASFGQKIIMENGTLDRRELAAIVFADEEKLSTLNRIIHPRVREYIEQEILKFEENIEYETVIFQLLDSSEGDALLKELRNDYLANIVA